MYWIVVVANITKTGSDNWPGILNSTSLCEEWKKPVSRYHNQEDSPLKGLNGYHISKLWNVGHHAKSLYNILLKNYATHHSEMLVMVMTGQRRG